jgi:D-aminopeptidase
MTVTGPEQHRLRDFGIAIGRYPAGRVNAITDVAGVRVGHETIVSGSGPLVRGQGPVRTGVTVVLPGPEPWDRPRFAGFHRVSGVGELTGLTVVAEWGMLKGPIGLTNTWSVGTVRDALVAAAIAERGGASPLWAMPVVGETWDGLLSDVEGQHVRAGHVAAALGRAAGGPVAEGNVGGGTGMVCHGFKGGSGTSSRLVAFGATQYTVGVLVQANHGHRDRLRISGHAIGPMFSVADVPIPADAGHMYGRMALAPPAGRGGSVIVIVATDAPLLPQQCTRLAQRASFGIARTGGAGENWSGDMLLAFSTANPQIADAHGDEPPLTVGVDQLSDVYLDELFYAAIDATEEAIVNALFAAETMTGRDGNTVHALPRQPVIEALAG